MFDDDDDVIPELGEASDSDDDDDEMPSKKQEGKGDTFERVQTEQLIGATTDETKDDGADDETKDDGADDAAKADDNDTQVTFGDVAIDVPMVEVRRSNRIAGGTAFTTVTRKSTVPPPVLKVRLECDFTKCDKTFHNFEADLPADRVGENRKAYKAEFDGMVDSGSLSQPAPLAHGRVPVPMIMVGKIKTPTEKDPKGKLKWRACPKSFKQRGGLNYDADDLHAPVMDKTVPGCISREQKRMTKQENVNVKRVKSEAKEAQRSTQDARDDAIVRSVRSGEAFSCTNCPKSFLTRNGLDEHERSGMRTRAAESKAVRHVARSAVEQLRTTDLAMRASDATRASATSLVTVKFGSTDLGISADDRLRVVVITPGGAADRPMRIDCGFQIVRVDGADASAATIVASAAAAISSAGTVGVLCRRSRPQLPRHGTARRALYRTAQTTFTPEQKSWLETEVFHNQRQRVRDGRAYLMMREQFRDRVDNDGKPLWLEQSQIASWISRQWAVLKAGARVRGAAAARARAAAVAAATAGAGGVVAASAAVDEGGAAVAGSTADNTGGEDDDGEENGGGAMMDGDGDAAANGDHADGDAADQGDDADGDGADGDDADGDGNDDANLDRLTCKELRERLKAVGLGSAMRKADLTDD